MSRVLRVVIADDESEMRDYLCETLPLLGHEVVAAATDGRELVAACHELRPDLVISDIRMPELDGIDAADQISAERSVPIIFISGHHDADLVERAAKQEIMAFLVKPVGMADLEAAIATAVHRFEDLQALAAELLNAGERERERLAQILHDHLQQLLVAARMRLSAFRRGPSELREEMIGGVDGLIGEAIELSRTLTMELTPPALHQLGLLPALQWLAGYMRERFGLEVEIHAHEPSEQLPESSRSLLFEAVRELLFNITKHARVNSACITVSEGHGSVLEILVSDIGVGFDPNGFAQRSKAARSFGLASIRERLRLLGGNMRIESAPGRGTRTVLTAPLCARPVDSVLSDVNTRHSSREAARK